MNDLVKRGDILDALIEKGQKSRRYKLGEIWELNLSEIKEAVESVPPTEWIPVTERLPKNDEYVIGWCGGRIDIVRFEAGLSKETREKMKNGVIDDPTEGGWCSEGWSESKRSSIYKRCDEFGNNLKPYCWVHEPMVYFGQYCRAWMPLPEPYQK